MSFMLRICFLLSIACFFPLLAVCALSATAAPAPVEYVAGAVAPSIFSTRHDLNTEGGAGGSPSPSSTLCLHRASTQAFDGAVPLNDGSGRLLCWKRDGQVYLAALDVGTTGSVVLRVGAKALIDLRRVVSHDSAAAARGRGLAGVAVDSSSRVYVSYYNTTSFLVVDQLSASSWSEHDQSTITAATRVFSLPDQSEPSSSGFPLDYYGGQVLFRPTTTDPYLYLITGPAQTNGQLEAKILRLPVGQDMPSAGGNGTEAQRYPYASLVGIPRRCAFDGDRPQDLYCAIVKEEQEQVYVVSDPDAPSYSATPPSPTLLVSNQRPTPETPPSLVGGLLYRGDADTTLAGSYIHMYGSELYTTVASPAGSLTTPRNVRVTCSASAPANTTSPCRGGEFTGGAGVTSFAEDAQDNAILLAKDGFYLLVRASLCNAATHPTSNKQSKDLLWRVLKVIGSVLLALVGTYGLSKLICNCCSKRNNGNDQAHTEMTNYSGTQINNVLNFILRRGSQIE